MDPHTLWRRYKDHLCECPSLGMTLDISRINFDDQFFARMEPRMAAAYEAMARLEAGEIANPDENRMVGHYWLRAPDLAPSPEIATEIRKMVVDVETFAAGVHGGTIRPPTAAQFTRVLSIGIGGSALGPMFVADALGKPAHDRMKVDFIDNTDPDGIARTLAGLTGRLGGVTIFSGKFLASGRIPPVVGVIANGAPRMGRKESNHGSVAGVVSGWVAGTEEEHAGPDPTQGGRRITELRVGSAGDDPLSGVSGPRLADRLGADREPVPGGARSGQRSWQALGRR